MAKMRRKKSVDLKLIAECLECFSCSYTELFWTGAVLGPLLFIISINDLPFDKNGCEFYLFADDSKVLSNDSNILQHALHKCLEWGRDNKMTFNLDKTQFIVFNHNKNCSNSLRLMDSSINPVDKLKDLGITISNNLKWNNHVKSRLKIA